MHLAIFDLDNTLLADDSDYLWGQFLVDAGAVDADEYARENDYFHRQYQAGQLDIHAFQRFSLAPWTRHPRATMLGLRQRFITECIRPRVAPAAPGLIAAHRERGDCLLIITATSSLITRPIADLLGVDNLLATDPEMIDDRVTGAIAGTPCYQDGKITRLRAWLADRPERFDQRWGYSDSHNDLPLLEHVDHPVAVDADPRLTEQARQRGWPRVSLRGAESGAQVFRRVATQSPG